jgi:hypothetical protein
MRGDLEWGILVCRLKGVGGFASPKEDAEASRSSEGKEEIGG